VRDPATILKFQKKIIFSLVSSKVMAIYSMPIFNSAQNNQQQLVIFIHIMVSAGVCFDGKERLHFIPNKTKVNAKLHVETLLPELVQIADLFCHLASSFNRTARLHTWQSGSRLNCYQLQ